MRREFFISHGECITTHGVELLHYIKYKLVDAKFDLKRNFNRLEDYERGGVIFYQEDNSKTPKKKTKVKMNAT